MEVSSHEDSASEFCFVGSIFSMKLLGFVSKAIKPSLRSVNTDKAADNIFLY